jgi:hypothetical protein
MLDLGVLHPQQVVKKQLVMIGGREPAQAQLGPLDQDLA